MSSLVLNEIYTFNATSSVSSYTIPPSPILTFSAAICSPELDHSPPDLTLSNSTHIFPIPFNSSTGFFAAVTSPFSSGGSFSFVNQDNAVFEIAFTDSDIPIHQLLSDLPLFGDSSASQAILFSHPFEPPPPLQAVSYPNYTLDYSSLTTTPANPSALPNLSLVLTPTSDKKSIPRFQTGCSLLLNTPTTTTTTTVGNITNQTFWLRDDAGWRAEWIVDDLDTSTNYTVFVVQESTKVSGPMFFTTKSSTFPCPLIHAIPYCPAVAYTVPLPVLSSPGAIYDVSTLPQNISSTFLEYATNFTTSLLAVACGRDLYSPLVTCQDCQRAYLNWLCAVSFPRCAENSTTSTLGDDGSDVGSQNPNQAQLTIALPSPALVDVPANTPARNPIFPNSTVDYTMLLPCIEVCTLADRMCPNFLGFRCPLASYNAASSYGVGYIDSGERGDQGEGVTGNSQDQWGNVWCNGLGTERFTFDYLRH